MLKKREAFRDAFDGFDPEMVARYNEKKMDELVQNVGIIRHRGKIQAAITNAQIFLDVQREYGSWGAPKIRDKLKKLFPMVQPPATSTIHRVLDQRHVHEVVCAVHRVLV